MDSGAAQAALMYFVLPVWLAAGFADTCASGRRPLNPQVAGRNPFCISCSLAKWQFLH